MKPNHDFVPVRPVAQHAGLVGQRQQAPAVDPGEALAGLVEQLARELPEALERLGGDAPPQVIALDPREGVMHELLARGAGPSLHGLLAGPDDTPRLLVSLELAGALQLVDIAFGGDGTLPDPIPDKLPLSAQLIAARIEAEFARLVARIAGIAGDKPDAQPFAALRRDTDIAVLRPFAADRALWQVSFEVTFAACETWTIRLTLPADQTQLLYAAIIADTGSGRPRPARAMVADPTASPFGDMPLTLRATLVDMRMPLSRIATLKPGDVLQVSVARQVPLAIGQTILAHGTIGEVDDRVALQITQAFPTGETVS